MIESFLPIILIFAAFYFFAMRQQKKVIEQKEVPGLAASWALAIPRSDQDTFSRAERVRDDIAKRFRAVLTPGVAMTSYESARGSGAVWLRLEFVKPEARFLELSVRTVIAITIDRFDYHRFEHVLRLEVGRAAYRRAVEGLTELKDEDIRSLMAFAAGECATFPALQSLRLRQFAWQVWRPKNRVKRLRRDWPSTGMNAGGWGVLIVGAASLIQQAEYDYESCVYYDQCFNPSFGILALLVGSALLVARWVILRRQCMMVLSTGKPNSDPRSLVRMDSWQTTLSGLGERQKPVLDEILQSLEQRRPPGVALHAEWIGYASVDGKVEREQQVVTFRRAIAFVRLESYGKDLYVGWDSHINAGVWREQQIGQGVDRISGRLVVARRVVHGWQAPSEYDVSDADFLTEWLHACIVSVIKQQLAEYHIDQEIDFTIQRESRTSALRSSDPAAKKREPFGAGLFKRAA